MQRDDVAAVVRSVDRGNVLMRLASRSRWKQQPPEPKPREELPAAAPEPVAKAPPPPKPIIKVPAEDKQITETVEAAASVNVPVDALEIWDHFLARHTFTEKQQERVEAQLQLWRDRDEQKLIRFGSRWVTREEAKAISDRASEQISGALAALNEKNLRKAQNMLQRATTTDPAGIRADFILGMLHSLRGMNALEVDPNLRTTRGGSLSGAPPRCQRLVWTSHGVR